jgi:hypothetical protein
MYILHDMILKDQHKKKDAVARNLILYFHKNKINKKLCLERKKNNNVKILHYITFENALFQNAKRKLTLGNEINRFHENEVQECETICFVNVMHVVFEKTIYFKKTSKSDQ